MNRTKTKLALIGAILATALSTIFAFYKMYMAEVKLEWAEINATYEQIPEGITWENYAEWAKEQEKKK